MHENLIKAQKALNDTLIHFMPRNQRLALKGYLLGEEGEGFAEIINGLVERIEAMPHTYQTDGQGDDAVVHLHYFGGSVDAWVTEKDMGDGTDDPRQLQAYGMVSLGHEPELGYINIQELIDSGIELDLYWTPKSRRECRV